MIEYFKSPILIKYTFIMRNKNGSKRNVQMRVKGVAAEDVRLLTNEAARSHGIVTVWHRPTVC